MKSLAAYLSKPRTYAEVQAIRQRVWEDVAHLDEDDLVALAKAMVASIDKHFFHYMVLYGVQLRTGSSLVIRLMEPAEAAAMPQAHMYVDDGVRGKRSSAIHLVINPHVLLHRPFASRVDGHVIVDGWRCTSAKAVMMLILEHELVHILMKCFFERFHFHDESSLKEELTYLACVEGEAGSHRLKNFLVGEIERDASITKDGHGLIFQLLMNSLVGHVGVRTSDAPACKPYKKGMRRGLPTYMYVDEARAERDLMREALFA